MKRDLQGGVMGMCKTLNITANIERFMRFDGLFASLE